MWGVGGERGGRERGENSCLAYTKRQLGSCQTHNNILQRHVVMLWGKCIMTLRSVVLGMYVFKNLLYISLEN
jgi:hypothetical protein